MSGSDPVPAPTRSRRPEALRLEGIGRSYGGPDAVPALSDVSLTVHEGEFVAIVGASGAGKSTLLNILGLLDTPTTGRYLISGERVEELSDREHDALRARVFGFVFQDAHMLLRETAGANAALGLSINRVEPDTRPELVLRALRTVGLEDKARDLAGTLSGGERQRVAIARAIATSPSIILADEPTGALDTANSAQVLRTLRELSDAGVTVVMITHDPGLAEAADRIVELSDGRVISDRETLRQSDADPRGRRASRSPFAHADTQGRWSRLRERVATAVGTHTLYAARAALMILAFTVGSAGLVTSIGLSQSAAAQVVDRLDAAGLDTFLVTPSANAESLRAEFALSEDATAAQRGAVAQQRLARLDGVQRVGMRAGTQFGDGITLLDPGTVPDQPRSRPPVYLYDRTGLELQGVRLAGANGGLRFFAGTDQPPAALVGAELAKSLGLSDARPGTQLWIARTPVALVGIISDPGDDATLGSALVVNPALAAEVMADEAELIVRTAPGAPAQLADRVGRATAPGDPSLYRAETVADLRTLTRGVASDLVSLINAVSIVLLVLSSLSAATAAYLSVHARRAEIALRRAVGESRRAVWRQFVLEGAIIGALGGVAGSALGVVLIAVLARAQGWAPTFDFAFLWAGIAAGALTGILASLYPAAVAAKQDAALAVRGV